MNLTLDEFIEQSIPVMKEELVKAKLTQDAANLSIQFLRLKFDNGEIKDIRKSCRDSIFESSVYYANVLGQDPTLGGSVVCVDLSK